MLGAGSSRKREGKSAKLSIRFSLTLETHWSSRSTSVGLQAPAARTTLSPWYFVPSTVSTPVHVVPSAANRGRLNVPALKETCQQNRTGNICTLNLSYLPNPKLTP